MSSQETSPGCCLFLLALLNPPKVKDKDNTILKPKLSLKRCFYWITEEKDLEVDKIITLHSFEPSSSIYSLSVPRQETKRIFFEQTNSFPINFIFKRKWWEIEFDLCAAFSPVVKICFHFSFFLRLVKTFSLYINMWKNTLQKTEVSYLQAVLLPFASDEKEKYTKDLWREIFSVKTFAGWFQRNTLDGVIYAYKHMTEEHHFATLNGSDTGSKSNRTTNPTAHNHSSKKGRKIHSWSGKIDYRRKSFEFDPLFFQHIQSRDFHSIVLWTRFLYEKVELILNFRIWRFRDILKETHR